MDRSNGAIEVEPQALEGARLAGEAPAPAKTKKRVRSKRRFAIRRRLDPVAGAWRLWCHDFDTLLHELVKNPALAGVEPRELVVRAEHFADAIEMMQNRRRPPSLEREDDWR